MNRKRLIVIGTISIILVCMLFIGTTYSIFTSNDIDPNANVYTTGNLDITYTLSSSNVKLTDATPINNDDVEDIKPYRITINNMGNVDYKFNVILTDTTATESIGYDYIMTQVGKLDSLSLSNTTSNIIKSDVIIKAGTSVPIDVRVYLSNDIPNTEIGKNFSAKLSIDGIAISYEEGTIDNSDLVANYLYPDDYVMSLSEVVPGSYVKYIGNNGCSGNACSGQNANYVSDTDMGYCKDSSNKFTVNGWRVGYVSDGTAYLVSAGSPECVATDENGNMNNTGSNTSTYLDSTNLYKHLDNLDNEALLYCNLDYAYGGVCDSTSTWAMDAFDFESITGSVLSSSSCYGSTENENCGYENDLIDNGGYYWYATIYSSTDNQTFIWNPYWQFGSTNTSHAAYGLRPVLRLDSSVYVNGGSGTYEDPYTIAPRTQSKEYSYTGDYQTFTALNTGTYKIELWGAQGGSSYYNNDGTGSLIAGGKGGYTSGFITLKKGENLYIYVGGKGTNGAKNKTAAGGYNGGGTGGAAYQGGGAGGGATDVRLVNGAWNDTISLRSRIMVAGGGGGSSNWTNAITGGVGGNLTGGSGKLNSGAVSHTLATGGNQVSGGTGGGSSGVGKAGSFGAGGNSEGGHGGGGGSGYYGGGGAGFIGSGVSSGAGGSSYISGHTGAVAITSAGDSTPKSGCSTSTTDITCSYHYSGKIFESTIMRSGGESMPNYNGAIAYMTGNSGNGYAKITYIPENEYHYDYYFGNYQTFTAPNTGDYKIEAWGAQGGTYSDSVVGGKGGYTSGVISLEKGEKLYIYVGGQGGSNNATTNVGGYNGGGYSGNNSNGKSMGGGGATDIRLVSGTWNNATSLRSRIMVAGAGGGNVYTSSYTSTTGVGGNLTGGSGGGTYTSITFNPTGGTQVSGGTGYNSTSRNGSFGYSPQSNVDLWGGGGGSGYYGGATGAGKGGAGGSSYISGYTGCVAVTSASDSTPKSGCTTGTSDVTCSYHYSGKKFVNTIMASGSESMPTHDGTSTMTGNSGNGYAKITYLPN